MIGVRVGMREVPNNRVNIPEGGEVTVCANLTGQLERDVVVQLETTTRIGFRGASQSYMFNCRL